MPAGSSINWWSLSSQRWRAPSVIDARSIARGCKPVALLRDAEHQPAAIIAVLCTMATSNAMPRLALMRVPGGGVALVEVYRSGA
jgi:hypothetical protein